MGSPKALLPFRQGTFLSTLAETLGPFCDPVIAVFGFQGDSLCVAAPASVMPVVNRNYDAGMLTSLQTGLRALDLAACTRILFTLVDHPSVSPETIVAILQSDAPIAIPRFNARRGHPVAISSDIAREFLREPVTAKVRNLIDRHAAEIHYIDLQDPGITEDIDDPDLYLQLLQREAAQA
jgi:CTP:molybdopterin cytidylyltransferase MocA